MPLGTLDRTPPPFFRQGTPALTKLIFFAALAIFMMVSDARFGLVEPLRSALATALVPLQRVAAVPVEIASGGAGYLEGLEAAHEGELQARRELVLLAEKSARSDALAQENERLRALLGLKPALQVRSQAAEVLYEAADPYSRKVFIDRGSAQGIVLASPVIDERGVLGQVTRVYALNSEVTLLTDKDAAIPVLNPRTQQRGAAFGGGGGMELRFMSINSDVRVGDKLETSGIDGVYPPGLAVAQVVSVERRGASGFASIRLAPAAAPDGVRHVLVLQPLALQMPPPPQAAASASASASAPKPAAARRGGGRR
ncbi:MAG: rod shape-determining protein MreC [Burkholderiales bacterium]|nr:rod shape-determining protein MreC [Burkholderiales bacterium]MDE2396366.1 rod shape-determining protein MreC [Burkholderiales bacterium]